MSTKKSYFVKFIILIALLCVVKISGAQSNYPCGAVEIQKTLFKKDRKWFENQERTEEVIQRKLRFGSGSRSQNLLTIPVVVHVVHNNGNENISDNQILQAIKNLNDAFAHKGYYSGKGSGHDTKIQFCLANRTPSNQGTTGINRVVSSLTNMTMETDDISLKNLSRWNPLDYVNIWIVKEISSVSQGSGVAGYAYLAGQHGQPHDGMVCEAKYFGVSPSDDVVFIHEMGHYLNLLHTFDGGCKNDNCVTDGDKVCDTPPDQSMHSACVFNSCLTDADDTSVNNPFTVNVNDMTQNYMDYSPFECQFAFTEGQSNRMRAALEGVRMSLLESQGCLSPCPNPLTGVINIPAEGLTGQSIALVYSGTDASQFEWKVNDDVVSNQNNYNQIFTSPGTYTIQLTVNNQDPNCIKKLLHSIQIKCNIVADFNPIVSSIKEGSQVIFTSTTTGATEFTWKVDGVEVGNGSTLNYTFNKTKDYLVQLIASNQYCSQSKIGKVSVESACGDSIWLKSYVTDKGALRLVHREGNSGSYLGAGLFLWDTKSVAVKFDENHEVLWSKYFDVLGSCEGVNFNDGSSMFNVQNVANNKGYIVKLDQFGELEWEKELIFENNGINSNRIVNFLEDALIVQSGQIIRMSIDGVVKWTKYNKDFLPSSIFTARDSSKWVVGKDKTSSETTSILNLDQNGNLVFQKQLSLNIFPKDIYQIEKGDVFISYADNVNGTNFSVIKFSESGEFVSNYKQTNPSLHTENFSINNNKILLANRVLGQEVNIALLDLDYKTIWAKKYKKSNISNEISPLGFAKYKDGWLIDVFSSNNGVFENTILNIKANQPLEGCYFFEGIYPVFESTPIIVSSSNIQLIDGNYTEADPNVSIIDFNVSIYNDCRLPNPCPKNCNQDLAHMKMVMENPSNVFRVEQADNNELLLTGFNAIDNYHFWGKINEVNKKGRISKNIDARAKTAAFLYHLGSYFEIGLLDNKLFIQKISSAGTIEWTNSYNQITSLREVKIIQDRIILFGNGQIYCFDLNGNIIWIKNNLASIRSVNHFTANGVFTIDQVSNNKIVITKVSLDGEQILQKSLDTNNEISFIAANNNISNNLTLKLTLSTQQGAKVVLILFNNNADVLFSKEISGDIGVWAGYSENDGNILYYSNINSKWTFSLLDSKGNVKFTKRTSKLFNADWISKYKNGWIANCRGVDGDLLIYIFPESNDDCILESTDLIQAIDYPISAINSNLLLDASVPVPALKISPIESEEILVSFDALCTVNAPCVEICDNGIDDDDNGFADCADTACPCNVCENKANIAIKSIDSVKCNGNTYSVNINVCNLGDKTIMPNTPITFYDNDPWTTTANPISINQQFIDSIAIDSCISQEFVLQKFTSGKIYAVVNTTVDIPTPFSAQTVFPTEDCDMTNNTLAFEYKPFSPTLDLGPDIELCYGQPVFLTAQEGFEKYSWQDFYPDRNYTAIAAGKYSVTVTDVCGLTQSDDIEIKLKPSAAIDLGPDKTFCKGDTIRLGLQSSDSRKYIWDDGLTGIERTVNKAGVYTIGAYSDDICVVKDTIIVTEVDRPVLNIEDQKTLCEGDTFRITLPLVQGIDYIWNDGSTSTDRTFSQQGIYSVVASNAYCSVTDSIQIKVSQKPIISLVDEIKKCEGDTIKVGVSPSAGLMYEWNSGQLTSEIHVSDSGIFTLTISDNGCKNKASINVIDIPYPKVDLGDDILSCEGNTVTLSVPSQSGTAYLWNNGQVNPTIEVSESGNFILEAKVENCISRDSINVSFLPLPSSDLQDTVSACQGQLITLSINNLPENKSVLWSDGSTGLTKEVSQNGIIEVEISNEICKINDTVQVIFYSLPDKIDLEPDATICEGDVYKINIPDMANHNYLWNDGNVSPNRELSKEGNYNLVATNEFGCSVTDSIELKVTEIPEFDLGEDLKLCLGDSLILSPKIPVGASIIWNDNNTDEIRIINMQGKYTATLMYDGCQIKDSIEVVSDDCNPFDIIFPNVFRVGSVDNGLFKGTVIGDNLSVIEYDLRIYDRWGNLIFGSNDVLDGWAGSFNGQSADQGVYIYVYSVKYQSLGQLMTRSGTGSITLLH